MGCPRHGVEGCPQCAPVPEEREQLRQRFINVIRGAGYTHPEVICEEWFEKYMAGDVSKFVEMLVQYETGHGDD